MSTKFTHSEKLLHSNPTQNQENDDDEEEETLSLCDLPIDPSVKQETRNQEFDSHSHPDFDFDFGSYISTENRMCDADELFFRGKMLPIRRHSVSSDVGLSRYNRNPICLVSRSESMDHCHSGGYFSGLSSRSSSSSSGSTFINTVPKFKSRVLNQFHSYPSPSPKIRIPTRQGNCTHRSQKSTIWRFFQLGLLRTPEIELSDLKLARGSGNLSNSFSSRNSTESASSSSVSMNNMRGGNVISNEKKVKKKTKNGLFGKNGGLFGGCNCSVDAVETINLKILGGKKEEERENLKKKKKEDKHGVTRHHRTFEWLKQLSVEGCGPNEV